MSLLVREAGLQSLVVDFGRERSRALGVPLGGAADRESLALGNALVGNTPTTPALEAAFAGPVLLALQRTACVIFGAPFQSSVNGAAIPHGITFTLNPGDELRIGGTSTGARAYLCVAGGFDVPVVLGSRSALEPIRAGDVLESAASRSEPRGLGLTDPIRGFTGVLRVLDGPQREWFTDENFFSQTYDVSAASNRMGIRLNGPPLMRSPGELVSEAVAPGAVQVTNDGLPIVLGVDGQTIGGYPKIAHVIRADLDLLAQLRPGETVRFVRVTHDEAAAVAHERTTRLNEWLTRLRIAERAPVMEGE